MHTCISHCDNFLYPLLLTRYVLQFVSVTKPPPLCSHYSVCAAVQIDAAMVSNVSVNSVSARRSVPTHMKHNTKYFTGATKTKRHGMLEDTGGSSVTSRRPSLAHKDKNS